MHSPPPQQQQQHQCNSPNHPTSPITVYRILSSLVARGAGLRPKSSPASAIFHTHSAADWWEDFCADDSQQLWSLTSRASWFRDPEKRHRLIERAYSSHRDQQLRMSAVPPSTEVRRSIAAPAGSMEEEEKSGKKRSGEGRVSKGSAVQNFYVTQGHNGQSLVDAAMERLGWTKVDKTSENWKLRWTETKGMVNYASFREGEQLVNHIPNCELICNKLGLLISMREYERVSLSTKNRPLQMQLSDFFPETYVMDYPKEREAFFEVFKPGEIWINKPTGLNQGKGIFLIRDLAKFKEELQQKEEKKPGNSVKAGKSMGRIVQRYIMNPLVINGRKFDIRAYLLIGSTAPFLVLFHHGYLRLSIHKYDTEDANLCTHLTNQYIQKKDERYEEVKNDTVWSMEQFNEYLNSLREVGQSGGESQSGPPEENWVFNGMERQMKVILQHMFSAVRHKLTARLGYFELYGIDFMIDANYKMYLIEVNTNPAMHVNCKLLNDILPPLIESTVHIALECFEKVKKRQSMLPLKSLGTFQILHCGASNTGGGGLQSRPLRGGSPQGLRGSRQAGASGASPTRASAAAGNAGDAQQLQQQPQPLPLRRLATSPNVLPGGGERRSQETLMRRYRPIQQRSQQFQLQQQPVCEDGSPTAEQLPQPSSSWKPTAGSRQERPDLISSSSGILLSYQRVKTPVKREAAPISTVRVIGVPTKGASGVENQKLSADLRPPRRKPIVDRSS